MSQDEEFVKSPCVGVCRYEEGRCKGCARTVEEVNNWQNISSKDKRGILLLIRLRKAGAL